MSLKTRAMKSLAERPPEPKTPKPEQIDPAESLPEELVEEELLLAEETPDRDVTDDLDEFQFDDKKDYDQEIVKPPVKIDLDYVLNSFGLKRSDVLSSKEYPDQWVVVTKAGKKLFAEKKILEAQRS